MEVSEIKKPLIIGAHNVFEVGSHIESYSGHIGESNVFECKSYVGPNVTIGSGCVIGEYPNIVRLLSSCLLLYRVLIINNLIAGAGCRMEIGTMTDNTIVYGSDHTMREAMEKQPSQMLQLDFLSKILPNYHQLRKPNVQVKRHSSKPAPDS